MNKVGFSPAVYNKSNVSFQGAEPALSTAQKASKTIVREALKLSPAVAIGIMHPEIGAALGTLLKAGIFKGAILKPFLIKAGFIKGACDSFGAARKLNVVERGGSAYMSEGNGYKLAGRVMDLVQDKAAPAIKRWGASWL